MLFESVDEENGSQFLSQDTATLDSATHRAFGYAEEALDLTESCIIEDLDQLALDIRRRRNVTAPIHQLPSEVFITIINHLFDACWLEGKECRILDLMTVNRRWREVILSSPKLWTTIRSDYTPRFANFAIERSKPYPLSLVWDTSALPSLDTNIHEFEEILELVTRNSSRIRDMKIAVGPQSEEALRRILGSSTPRLEILHVRAPREVEWMRPSFLLPEGGPLLELVLNSTSVSNWYSSRISGLRLLKLASPAITPPLDRLLHILSGSPELEELRIFDLNSSNSHSPIPGDESNTEGLIELPRLRKIRLEGLPPLYCFSILSRICPGVYNSVRVTEVGASNANDLLSVELWRERRDTMVALLQLSKLSAPEQERDCPLFIVVGPRDVKIVHKVRTGISPKLEKSIIMFSHTDAHRVTEVLGEFFSALNLETPALRLQLEDAYIWRDKFFDLRPWGSTLKILQVEGNALVRAVYPQLGQQGISGSGTTTWLCPRLSFIDLTYREGGPIEEDEDLDGRELLNAVRKRWSGEHNVPAASQPSRFRILGRGQRLESIRSRKEAIKLIVPSFEVD